MVVARDNKLAVALITSRLGFHGEVNKNIIRCKNMLIKVKKKASF